MQQMNCAAPSRGDPAGVDLLTLVWMRPARRLPGTPPAAPKRWSRYERLSFSMLGYTWGILVVVVTALHFGNYHRETKTSSTSVTHSGFHVRASELKPEAPSPRQRTPDGEQP